MASPHPKRCPRCDAAADPSARFCGGCGAELVGDLVGMTVSGRYRVLEKIGEGGMGAVYRAKQLSLKREVALKVLRPEFTQAEGLLRRFNTEAELAAKLNHPNTVTLFDFGQDENGSLFMAMEFVHGQSLRKRLAESGALPADETLHIAEQVCASLADAHAHGIVHRDLKPDNIMLTARGKESNIVRVLDFGIAKLWDGEGTPMNPMTQAGDLLGTPQYMAPEQVRAERVDGRTDVYALGCMLYEMVTGKLPFTGPSITAVLSKHLTEEPQPPAQRRPDLDIDSELNAVILSCMAKEPDARPATMERLGEAISHLRRGAGMPTPGHGMQATSPSASSHQLDPATSALALGATITPSPASLSMGPTMTPQPTGATATTTAPPGAAGAAATLAPEPSQPDPSSAKNRSWVIGAGLAVVAIVVAVAYFAVMRPADITLEDFDAEKAGAEISSEDLD